MTAAVFVAVISCIPDVFKHVDRGWLDFIQAVNEGRFSTLAVVYSSGLINAKGLEKLVFVSSEDVAEVSDAQKSVIIRAEAEMNSAAALVA